MERKKERKAKNFLREVWLTEEFLNTKIKLE